LEGFDKGKGDTLIIGKRMAERLGLTIGNSLTMLTPEGNATAFGTLPKMHRFKIVAVFEVGMHDYDNGVIFMPLTTAQQFFKLPPDAVTNIEVFIATPERASEFGFLLQTMLGNQVRIMDWQHSNAKLFGAVQVERNVMFLILSLIILIAAFNIVSSLIMLVKDKTRDIAILRTMGATRTSILRLFFITGSSIGVIGTLSGVILGLSFALNIETIRQWIQKLIGTDLFNAELYFLTQLPARVEWGEVIAVVVMALGLSLLATFYPSWRAARLDPVEALRL
jgi:lipoprotein-releasing system permease protein